ncbi:hypothetical protein VTI28DRAFT_5793 [Corynascus sepedonium]
MRLHSRAVDRGNNKFSDTWEFLVLSWCLRVFFAAVARPSTAEVGRCGARLPPGCMTVSGSVHPARPDPPVRSADPVQSGPW